MITLPINTEIPHQEKINNRIFVKDNRAIQTNGIVAYYFLTDAKNGTYDLENNAINDDETHELVWKMYNHSLHTNEENMFYFPENKFLKRGTNLITISKIPQFTFERKHVAIPFRKLAGKFVKVNWNSTYAPGHCPVIFNLDIGLHEKFIIMPRKKFDSTETKETI